MAKIRYFFGASHEEFPPEALLQQAVAAEQAGFDGISASDHLQPWWEPGESGHAWVWLGAAGQATEKIPLGTGVTPTGARYHPALIAQAWATLDRLFPRRPLLGIGSGEALNEVPVGDEWPSPKDQIARMDEALDWIDRLWKGETITEEGRFYAARDVRTLPGPVRGADGGKDGRNLVPLVVAANGPKSIGLAVERGDGWMTYGGPADTDDDWWALIERLSRRVDDALAEAGRDSSTLARYLNLDSAPTFSLTSAAVFEDAVGRADELGFTDVITHWPRPDEPYRGTRDVLDEVAADVMPRLR